MIARRLTLEMKLLEVAKRHLHYVLADSRLGLETRRSSIDAVHAFYADVFSNLELPEASIEWEQTIAMERSSPEAKGRASYSLTELLSLLGISNNVAIFEVLERSGAQIREQDKGGISDFYVDAADVKKVVFYLDQKYWINKDRLVGGVIK